MGLDFITGRIKVGAKAWCRPGKWEEVASAQSRLGWLVSQCWADADNVGSISFSPARC